MAFFNTESAVKISGCLEKKGRLRIGSLWKKYWFVLEGRLLLYYRSKDEYETLSPCKGSINLCPPCNIQPSSSSNYIFQIQCRATTFILRARNRSEQERWMQALLIAIAHSKTTQNRMTHFRYSLDDLSLHFRENQNDGCDLLRQNSMPYRISNTKNIADRLQQTYGGSLETIGQFKNEQKDFHSNSASITRNVSFLHNKTQNDDRTSAYSHLFNRFYTENDHYSVIREENSIDLLSYNSVSKKSTTEKDKDLITSKSDDCNDDLDDSLYEHVKINREDDMTVNKMYECSLKDYAVCEQGHQYSVIRTNKISKGSEESINNIDINKNALITDNQYYMSSIIRNNSKEELPSRVSLDIPHYSVVVNNQEALYEDPDVILSKTVNTNCIKLGNNLDKSDPTKGKRKGILGLAKLENSVDTNKKSKSKIKSTSTNFLRRVWKKTTKFLEVEEDPTYDSVDYDYVEKEVEHERNMEMLQELQKILETRKVMLQQKLNVDIYKREFQNSYSTTYDLKEARPSLPPRQHSKISIENDETIDANKLEGAKTIDKILKELDNDSVSKTVFAADKSWSVNKTERNSNELTILLEELTKVTCAPVMTPGVTNSLITSSTSNEDWLKLIPIRKRRLSEPDYDVPRAHSSLNFMETFDSKSENPIPVDPHPSQLLDQKIKYEESMDLDSLDHQRETPIRCFRGRLESDNSDAVCVKHNFASTSCRLIENDLQKAESKLEEFVDSLEHTSEVSTPF